MLVVARWSIASKLNLCNLNFLKFFEIVEVLLIVVFSLMFLVN